MGGKGKIILTFSISIVLFLAIGLYSNYNAGRYKEDSKWVTHTYEVISNAQSALSYLQDIESASRGFAISGKENFLIPYQQAISQIDQSFLNLKDLTRDNKNQQILLDSMYAIITTKKDFCMELITMRRTLGFEASQNLISTNKGEQIMQLNRTAFATFIQNEKNLLVIRTNNEEERFLSIRFILLLITAFSILFIVFALYYYLKDYDKLVKSEQNVLESETRLKKFLDVLPLGVFIMGKNGKAYYSNNKSKEILGSGIIGEGQIENIPEIYHVYKSATDELCAPAELPIARILGGETSVIVDNLEIEKKGERYPLRINAAAVKNSSGITEFAISVFEDVSEAKKARRELEIAKKSAEDSSNLKEAFLANMSHEIRTPMNAIIGFTDLLIKGNLPVKEHEYVNIIKSSGENLLHIINDILDISKIEAQMMMFDAYPMSIKELFYSLKITMSQKAGLKNIDLAFDCDLEVPDVLMGDATRLSQILINLVDNALKFTKQGSVQVTARLLSNETETCIVEFFVKDTGIGISEDKLQLVFERFQQAEIHTTRKYGGTGLGLSIAKQLVDSQGGQMKISSTIDVGTTFSFTLPFKKPKSGSSPIANIAAPDFDKNTFKAYKMLVAEDNPINVKLLTSLFEQYDINIEVVGNGKMVVENIRDQHYDLLLMDMEMPEMNGYEATSVIRNELKSKIPIIAMTAHAMSGEKEKCLQMGMNDYISKPINSKLMFDKMYALLLQNRVFSAENRPSQLIDLTFLHETFNGRSGDIIDTLDIFLKEFPKDLNIINQAAKIEDYNAIMRQAHKMRSSATVLGFANGEHTLLALERLGKEGKNIVKINDLNKDLQALSILALEEVKVEKLKYMSEDDEIKVL